MADTARASSATASALVVVGAATMVANAAAYFLSMGAARLLSVPGYGAFGSLLAIAFIGSTAAVAVQTVAARRFAAHGTGDGELPKLLAAHTIRLSLGIVALGALTSWPLAVALGVSVLDVLMTFAAIAASAPGFSALGFLQGVERFSRFSLAYVLVSVLRAAGGLTALAASPSVTGGCLGLLLGTIVGSGAAMALARHPWALRPRSAGIAAEVRLMVLSLLGLYVLSNVDVLLARALLDAETSGLYAVGALVAKVAFFVPAFILSVLFPRIASGAGNASWTALFWTALVGLAVTGVVALSSDLVVAVLGGAKYAAVAPLAPWFALEGSAFAVVQVVLYTGFSRLSSMETRAVWVALTCQVALVWWWFHDSIAHIVGTTTVVSLALVLGTIWYQRVKGRAPDPIDTGHEPRQELQ